MARDGWVTSQVDKLLDYCRQSASTFTQVQSPHARRLLESALAVTEVAAEPPVSSSFPSYHAFIRARVRTLQPGSTGRPGSTGATRRQTCRKYRRALFMAAYLASYE